MTAVSTINGSASANTLVPGELIDLLIESVVLPYDPFARAASICNLLHEVCAAVEWLHDTETMLDDAPGVEVASLRQLVAAAQDHRRRMKILRADGTGQSVVNDELV